MQLPPVHFLLVCSDASLGEFELDRLSKAANLRKRLIEIEDQLREVEGEALLARWLMNYRDVLLAPQQSPAEQKSFEFVSTPALGPAPARTRRSNPRPKEICA